MYERSAIVLEKYFDNLFGFNKKENLKTNYQNYKDIMEEMQHYQAVAQEEEKVIQEFDEVAKEIQSIQKTQETLSKSNQKIEAERNELFNDLGEEPVSIEKKLQKIENVAESNNQKLKELREEFVNYFAIFIEKQKERNKCSKARRTAEANHIALIQKINQSIENIEKEDIQKAKSFIETEDTADLQKNLTKIMLDNGKNERVGFNPEAIELAVSSRIRIAKKEAECYLTAYVRTRKLLVEIEKDTIKLAKYEKALRDLSTKIAFLKAEKEYIVGFLDNERLLAMNGPKAHKAMMEEACKNFEVDLGQIENLYQLILREIAGKATKKAYKELYNNTYLKGIEEKEKNFEQEVNHIKIHVGTVINSNYWRIEGIKNLYEVFNQEVENEFERDLSEYQEKEEDIEMDIENASEDENYEDENYEDEYDEEQDIIQSDKKKETSKAKMDKNSKGVKESDTDKQENKTTKKADEDFLDEDWLIGIDEYDDEYDEEYDDEEDEEDEKSIEDEEVTDDENEEDEDEYDDESLDEEEDYEKDLDDDGYYDNDDDDEGEDDEYEDEDDEYDEYQEDDDDDDDDQYGNNEEKDVEDEDDEKAKTSSKGKNKSKKSNSKEANKGIFKKLFRDKKK